MEHKRLNRHERRKARTKAAIRDTALDIFLKKGYHRTSIQEIMEQADLGYGTFYQYYNSKLDVLLEQANEVYAKITEHYHKPPLSETSIFKRTLNSIRNVLEACHEHRKVMTVLNEAKHTDPEIKQIWDKIMGELTRRLEFDISWSFHKGLCRPVDKQVAIAALQGLILGAIDYVLHLDGPDVNIDQISADVSLMFKEAIFIQDEMPPRT
ncbi:hypothetical protein GCM10010965_24430 [Caldalkalibacillus thermarum]|uniref:TetR/AcrR family transcriptional regulator n=1 Tax=Caldalkalibacillus thermarum TaxID=296745 RepID=UPI00166C411A|nr:TetR/AcrR family transcriptional regulator [Caldalkalibacillus thermarum]GGK30663.1 hypothetical protein GCM10010965_24430 [Caldalkalibacillus thermarum]